MCSRYLIVSLLFFHVVCPGILNVCLLCLREGLSQHAVGGACRDGAEYEERHLWRGWPLDHLWSHWERRVRYAGWQSPPITSRYLSKSRSILKTLHCSQLLFDCLHQSEALSIFIPLGQIFFFLMIFFPASCNTNTSTHFNRGGPQGFGAILLHCEGSRVKKLLKHDCISCLLRLLVPTFIFKIIFGHFFPLFKYSSRVAECRQEKWGGRERSMTCNKAPPLLGIRLWRLGTHLFL